MATNDTISDMLTRIRNATLAKAPDNFYPCHKDDVEHCPSDETRRFYRRF